MGEDDAIECHGASEQGSDAEREEEEAEERGITAVGFAAVYVSWVRAAARPPTPAR